MAAKCAASCLLSAKGMLVLPEYTDTNTNTFSQYVVLKKIASDMDLAYQQGEFDVASYHLGQWHRAKILKTFFM